MLTLSLLVACASPPCPSGYLESGPGLCDLQEVESAEPIGDPTPCMGGGNVMYFDGDGWVYDGILTVTDAEWDDLRAGKYDVVLDVSPTNGDQGSYWGLEFASHGFGEDGEDLEVGTYLGAQQAAIAEPGHPGMDIGGDGRGCSEIAGRFQITELDWTEDAPTSITTTFEQYCGGYDDVLRGCIHFEQ